MTMSARRRKGLVEFARHSGWLIVEDDYDGEFRYDASPLERSARLPTRISYFM